MLVGLQGNRMSVVQIHARVYIDKSALIDYPGLGEMRELVYNG
jgi:hypothetical protein